MLSADEHDKVDQSAPIDAQALERAMTVLLDQHPEAVVSAIDAEGLRVPMPASVPLNGHKVLAGRSALHLVAPRDVEVMIATFERVRHTGAARAAVELASAPGRVAELFFFDVREHHGVVVVVLIAEDDATQSVLDGLPDVPAVVTRFSTTRKNELAVLVAIDEATTQMLGWKPDEMLGQRSLEFIHPDDRERAVESWMEMLARPGQSNRARLRHRRRDGSWLWLEITNHNLLDDPAHGYVRAELMDISDEMVAQEALRARAVVAPSRRSTAARGLPGRPRRRGGVRERAPGRDRRCRSLRNRPRPAQKCRLRRLAVTRRGARRRARRRPRTRPSRFDSGVPAARSSGSPASCCARSPTTAVR